MNIKSINTLTNCNYSVTVINALKQYWRTQNSFNCIGSPKEKNMLLYLDSCNAEYTLKTGEKLYAESGNIIYIPINCEYSVGFYDFKTRMSNTIGINFSLFDENDELFVLSNDIIIFDINDVNYKMLFTKIDNYSEMAVPNPGRMKAGMYDILSGLSEQNNRNVLGKYNIISKGILYLEKNTEQDMSIKEISALCNVSEIYFRKLFKSYSGLTPVEYRINSKISKAKIYLKYENLTVTEIADRLGFISTSYFIKQFKDRIGMTPFAYKSSVE